MRRAYSCIAIILAAGMLIAGCGKSSTDDAAKMQPDGTETISSQEESVQNETKAENEKQSDNEAASGNEITSENETPSDVETSPENGADVPVIQSGKAVYYNGRVMFRIYSDSSFDKNALFGKFSTSLHPYEPNSLYTFDPSSPENGIEKLCDDNGYEDMYLLHGTELYSQMTAEGPNDKQDTDRVYKRHLPDGEETEICPGRICGFSPDGGHFTVYSCTFDPYMEQYSIYQTGEQDSEHAVYETGAITAFLGMDNDNAYLLEENENGTYSVIQLGNDGMKYVLADCDFAKTDEYYGSMYPEFDGEFFADGEELSFTVSFYEGTGHYYGASMNVTVPIYIEGTGLKEPMFEARIEESQKDEDPQDIRPEPLKEINSFPQTDTGKGTAEVLQYYEELNEGIFYAMAQSHWDPLQDIGWRWSFHMLNCSYYFLPANAKEPVLLHKMYEPLGKRGSLSKYEHYEIEPTIYAYVQFLADGDKKLKGIFYETINVSGPEAPVEESSVYHAAEFADEFYYEHPVDDDIYGDFAVEGMDALTDMVYSWVPSDDIPVRDVKYNDDGTLAFDESASIKEGEGVYMCHIGFDDEGRVYYLRPVIME